MKQELNPDTNLLAILCMEANSKWDVKDRTKYPNFERTTFWPVHKEFGTQAE